MKTGAQMGFSGSGDVRCGSLPVAGMTECGVTFEVQVFFEFGVGAGLGVFPVHFVYV